ncbi:MAG: class B sortase [Clostridium sp.]|uniref:class B sortase n=1 Tax=Clostridium sp. TaxID=1506 RepID=UPI003F3ED14B
MKKEKKRNIIRIINIVLILIIIFCVGKILYKQYEYHIGNEQTKKVQKVMDIDPTKAENLDYFTKAEIEKIEAKATELKKINNDYQGWLIVNGTDVNYPVVQTNNNEYYLHHSFYNVKSIEGNPFIYDKTNVNEATDINSKVSKNMLIFGHNMRNGTMFESISNFKDTKFFNDNKYMEFIRDGKVYVYEIFGDAVVAADYPYIVTNFKNATEFNNYIDLVKQKAYFWRDMPLNYGDKILTLSTCSYEFDNARFILLGKLVKVVDN